MKSAVYWGYIDIDIDFIFLRWDVPEVSCTLVMRGFGMAAPATSYARSFFLHLLVQFDKLLKNFKVKYVCTLKKLKLYWRMY